MGVDRNGLPGTAIWSQTFTLGSIAGSTGQWVPLSGYNAILPAGTYWLSFEPVVGSGLSYTFPSAAPNPLGDYAQYNSLNTGVTWVSSVQDPYITTGYGIRIVGSNVTGVTMGTGARTAMAGTLFQTQPFGPIDYTSGDAGAPRTLQWAFQIPSAIASGYGAIKANPNGPGNILTAGAYGASSTSSNAAARGMAYALFQNNSGQAQTMYMNTVLNGTMSNPVGGSTTTAIAATYVFDPTVFSQMIANAQASGLTAAEYLMNGGPILPSQGATTLPLLPGQLIYSSGLLDSSGPQTVPMSNGLASYSFSTNNGFNVSPGQTFVVLFDVMATSTGPASSSSGGQVQQTVADFLDTLEPDATAGFFTDVNSGLPIAGITGPAAVVIPEAPAAINFTTPSVTAQIGTQTSVTAAVTAADGTPVVNTFVRFSITSGPHAGLSGPVGTDANGNATITITDTLGQPGTDSVQITSGSVQSSAAQIVWTTPGPLDHLALSPSAGSLSQGQSQTYSAAGYDIFNNSLGDVTAATTFAIAPDGSCAGAVCTPAASGVHTITGADNGKTGQATLTVTAGPSAPVITWANPAPITYGSALSATQLNATANVPGTFAYSPAAGAVLTAGAQTLSVTFTPTDTTHYTTATAQVTLTVNKATPSIVWATPASISYGTALSAIQLNATASVAGTFVYSPAAGAVLTAGNQTLTTTFTPSDIADYTAASSQVTLVVAKATPTITWPTPTPITAGAALSATQLDATANVPGTFTYNPAAGTVPAAGSQTLTTTFTPTDTTDYTTATAQVTLVVNPAGKPTPVITWPTPAAINYGTPLSGAQLDATANVAGKFAYSPVAGTVLTAGTHTLKVTFTPTNTNSYNIASATVTLQVNQVAPQILWIPLPTVYGAPLGPAQLDALSLVPGSFAYTPAAGAILPAGNDTLTAMFTPKDTTDFKTITVTATLVVLKAIPVIHWANPAAITAGTPLSATQLNAAANVPGTFVYTPEVGTVLAVGNYTLRATFTPTDTANYSSITVAVPITVKSKK